MAFIQFMGWRWPEDAGELLRVQVQRVLAFRDHLLAGGAGPMTVNRRMSSLSRLYQYLAGTAAELRLPITVPNPAHDQFIARTSADPREERMALPAAKARQLMGLPSGETVLAARDRAMLKFFLYSGARLGTGCRLEVSDFQPDGEQATIRLRERGDQGRTVGLHRAAAEAMAEYVQLAGLESGALFRPRRNSRSKDLADRPMDEVTMWRTLVGYLGQLPGAMRAVCLADGSTRRRCIYTPHSLRATTATLLLDAGGDIVKVQELLGHRHVASTLMYDLRGRATPEGISHDVPM